MSLAIKKIIIPNKVWCIRSGTEGIPSEFFSSIIPLDSFGNEGDICHRGNGEIFIKNNNIWNLSFNPAISSDIIFKTILCEVKTRSWDENVKFIHIPLPIFWNENFLIINKINDVTGEKTELSLEEVTPKYSYQRDFRPIYKDDIQIENTSPIVDYIFFSADQLIDVTKIEINYHEKKDIFDNYSLNLKCFDFLNNQEILTDMQNWPEYQAYISGTCIQKKGIVSRDSDNSWRLTSCSCNFWGYGSSEPVCNRLEYFSDGYDRSGVLLQPIPNLVTIQELEKDYNFEENDLVVECWESPKCGSKLNRQNKQFGSYIFIGSYTTNKMNFHNIPFLAISHFKRTSYFLFRIRNTKTNTVSDWFSQKIKRKYMRRLFRDDTISCSEVCFLSLV